MADMQAVFQMVDSMTAEEIQQLAEYLEQRRLASGSEMKPRIPDLFPGIWMSDDFDDELPDEFWGFDKDFEV